MNGRVAQMKLSVIAGRHQDPQTDHLYQPLRAAIEGINNSNSQKHIALDRNTNPLFKSQLKRSQFPIKGIEQNQLKQSTMFPQNMRLIVTNNPLKRIKARSRSYKAISVEETFGRPLNSRIFREEIKVHPASKKEIVYDYDPDMYQQNSRPQVLHVYPNDNRAPARVRSATSFNVFEQGWANRIERVESTTMQVNRKYPETHASNNSIKTNTFYTKDSMGRDGKSEKEIIRQRSPDFSSQYYQHCNKYTFNRAFKSSSGGETSEGLPREHIGERSPRNQNYKYNLFSMMDQQANLNCQNGFCTKNQLVAPRIKKRW